MLRWFASSAPRVISAVAELLVLCNNNSLCVWVDPVISFRKSIMASWWLPQAGWRDRVLGQGIRDEAPPPQLEVKDLSRNRSPSHCAMLSILDTLKLEQRIQYKLISLTYKILTTSQPTYLHNLISHQTDNNTGSSDVCHTCSFISRLFP